MGIIWGAILGITFQFFMNMEIERYALAHGESIFVGIARKFKEAPIWFLFSTYIPWMWPGIIAASAKILGNLFGITDISFLTIGMLIAIGLILSLGPVLYKNRGKPSEDINNLRSPHHLRFVDNPCQRSGFCGSWKRDYWNR